MRILVVCQYYAPEPFRISDVCEELVKRGHEVTVVTGVPNYPMGRIYDGYRHGENRDEVINGVKVHRCFTIGRRSGAVWRFLNYYSYMFSSTHYMSKLKGIFDIVFVNQLSPVMMANAAIKYKKMHHTRVVLYCLDIWPESLVAGGVKRGSAIYKFFHKVSKKIYKAVDSILITSQSFARYFEKEFGITNTQYLPQYAEALFTPEMCKKNPNDTIDLMFAGNVGTAQSVDTIIKAAALCKDISNLRWHIVGDGIALLDCKKMAEKFEVPVIFHGRQPIEQMPRYYAMADAMLVTMQKDPVLSLTLPGKVQSYMAAGKPIIGAIDGETKRVIEQTQCGYCVPSGDFEGLAKICMEVADKRAEYAAFGSRSRAAYEQMFSRDRFMNSLEQHFCDMCASTTQKQPIVSGNFAPGMEESK